MGDSFYAVALPWLVLTQGGNAQELGIILSAYGIPRIGSILLGGILSDRLRPRRVMLIADAARAVLVGILAALALVGHPAMWTLIAVAIPLGAFGGLFLPPSFSILPDVLDDQDLQAGNALNTTSQQLAGLVGTGTGGIVVAAVQSGMALVIDALSFVVSAVSLALIRGNAASRPTPSPTSPQAAKTGEDTQVEEGSEAEQPMTFWQLARTSPVVQTAFIITLFANLTFGGLFEVALPSLAHGPLAAGATGYGAILAAFSAGALLGGIVTGMVKNIPRRGVVALGVSLLQAIAIAFVPYAGLAGAITFMAVMGIFNSVTNVIFITIIQQIIPRHLLGRVMGVIMFGSLGSYPLSVVIVGVVVARAGPSIIFPIGGAMLFLAVLYGLFQKQIWEL
ncbi:MAG TPA: MFS transporter [Ktedonobacteraceae bacterium]|nr:MFS transporter [Ktedonobacteraceae bacterium]